MNKFINSSKNGDELLFIRNLGRGADQRAGAGRGAVVHGDAAGGGGQEGREASGRPGQH